MTSQTDIDAMTETPERQEAVKRLMSAAREVIEGWEWWTADEYDRDRRAVTDSIADLRAALAQMESNDG